MWGRMSAMTAPDHEIKPDVEHDKGESTRRETPRSSFQLVTGYRLAILGLALLSIIMGLVLVRMPDKVQYAMVAAIPALLAGAYALINPFAGVWMFMLMDYLRPYTFIPALRPLRLGILTVAVTLFSWIVHQAINKEKVRWHPTATWFLVFLLVIAMGVLTAANNFRAYMVLEGMLTTFVMFLLVVNIVKTTQQLNLVVWLVLLIHLYYAIKGIYNFAFVGISYAGLVTSGSVGSSFISDENDFALALNAMIPFAFFLFMREKSKFKKFFLLGTMLALVLGVVASQSRGGVIGLAVVTLFCMIKSKQKLISMVIVGMLCLSVVVFAPSSYWSEVKSITRTDEGTANSRINYWKAAVRMYLDYPIIGVGAGNGPVRMPEYVTGFSDPNTQWGRTFHGNFPLIIAELGSLGLIAYVAMLILSFRALIKIQRQYSGDHKSLEWSIASAIAVGMLGWLTSATFLSVTFYPHLWTLHALTVVLYLCSKPQARTNAPAPTPGLPSAGA